MNCRASEAIPSDDGRVEVDVHAQINELKALIWDPGVRRKVFNKVAWHADLLGLPIARHEADVKDLAHEVLELIFDRLREHIVTEGPYEELVKYFWRTIAGMVGDPKSERPPEVVRLIGERRGQLAQLRASTPLEDDESEDDPLELLEARSPAGKARDIDDAMQEVADLEFTLHLLGRIHDALEDGLIGGTRPVVRAAVAQHVVARTAGGAHRPHVVPPFEGGRSDERSLLWRDAFWIAERAWFFDEDADAAHRRYETRQVVQALLAAARLEVER